MADHGPVHGVSTFPDELDEMRQLENVGNVGGLGTNGLVTLVTLVTLRRRPVGASSGVKALRGAGHSFRRVGSFQPGYRCTRNSSRLASG